MDLRRSRTNFSTKSKNKLRTSIASKFFLNKGGESGVSESVESKTPKISKSHVPETFPEMGKIGMAKASS